MATVRNGDFEVFDFTGLVENLPRTYGLLDRFIDVNEFGVESTTVSVDIVKEKVDLMKDVRRGGARQNVESETSVVKSLQTAFFTLDARVTPTEIQNLRRLGTEADSLTVQNAVERVATRIRRYHSALRTKALVEAIKGTNFAPNGTVESYDYYSTFEATADKLEVALDIANASSNVITKMEAAIRHIHDVARDGSDSRSLIALCSPSFMDALLSNDLLMQAYTYSMSTPNPLRDRVGIDGQNSTIRAFTFGGVQYVEYVGSFAGTALIPDGEAYLLPTDIDEQFNIAYAPADHMDYVNEVGQSAYMWVINEPRYSKVESETSFIAYNNDPATVVRLTKDGTF